MALCDSHSGSHWLSLPLSGILWPSLAHYCSLISRIQPLIGSQGPCSALIADATMTHFIPLCDFLSGFHIRLGYETPSFLFLEQCFQLSLSDEIGGTFFDINNFLIIPKYIFFDIDNLPIIWKMPIYRLSIIFFDNIAHPYGREGN